MRKPVLVSGIIVVIIGAIAGGAALWNYHDEPQFCAVCHVMDPYLASWTDSDFSAHTHGEADIECLDCHEPTITQQLQEVAVFVTGTFEEPLEKRKFPNDFCLGCHEHDSYAALAERTKDYVVIGQQVNPHDPHPGVVSDEVDQELECWHCHRMHAKSPGTEYCWVCHHDRTFQSCVDCHG